MHGQRRPVMLMGDPGQQVTAQADIQIGNVRNNVLSGGKLYDGGFDIVISKRWGTWMGKEAGGGYKKVQLKRVKNNINFLITSKI